MLMMIYGIPESAAFRLLVRWSSATNIKLRILARGLVNIAADDPDFRVADCAPDDLLQAVLRRT